MGLFKEVRMQSSGNGISPAVPQAVQKQGVKRGSYHVDVDVFIVPHKAQVTTEFGVSRTRM